MYVTSIIDVHLWDRAGWRGVLYGYSPQAPPFMGLVFRDLAAGTDIFRQWRKYLGEVDAHELIRVSIIEGAVDDTLPGYTVHIGSNPKAVYDLGEIRARGPIADPVVMINRACRMTPLPESQNLLIFKEQFKQWGQYVLVPAADLNETPGWRDLAIGKREISFRDVADIKANDIDSIVLKTNNPARQSQVELSESKKPDLTAMMGVLEAELAAGNVPQPLDPMVVDRLAAIDRGPDGQVMPETVDPLLFVLAEDVMGNALRRHARSIPLLEVQKRYIEILDEFFQHPYREMVQNGITPHDVARQMAESTSIVKAVQTDAPKWYEGLQEFWNEAGFVTLSHLQSMRTLKAVYGGNVFPHHNSDFASNVGLFADTLVLPDPMLNSLHMHQAFEPSQLVYLVVKNALSAMRYRELATAELDTPIVTFAPSYHFLQQSASQHVTDLSGLDTCQHLGKAFEFDFQTFQDVLAFADAAPDVSTLVCGVRDPSRFIFDVDTPALPLDQVEEVFKASSKYFPGTFADRDKKRWIVQSFLGRFMQSNACAFHCDLYGGIPLVDAPTAWQYLLWKYEYGATVGNETDHRDLLVQHALHDKLHDVRLLKNVPSSVVIELRRKGLLDELRTTFRDGIAEVHQTDQNSVNAVADKVAKNLRNALQKFAAEAESLSREKLGFGVQSTMLVGRMGLVFAALGTGYFPLAIAAAVAGVTGLPTVKDVVTKGRQLAKNHARLRRSPVGLLWR